MKKIPLADITSIAAGEKKMVAGFDVGRVEAKSILEKHKVETWHLLLAALQKVDIQKCKNCTALTPSGTCLKGNNTQAFFCCYHSINELLTKVSFVKVE